uniref:Ig-like domain-containing protein n=1 Tax=Castor canadensis TaxID=51338 RepID=A0A8C0WJD3_CASCN
ETQPQSDRSIDPFFIHTIGVHAQVLLEQTGAELRKPRASVNVSCKNSGFNFTNSYMHWVRQKPSQGLEWTGRIDPEDDRTKYAQNFKGRLTLTVDRSSNTSFMELSSLRAEDTAMHYCARDTHIEETSV